MSGSPNSWGDGKIGKCATFAGDATNVIYINTTALNYTDNFSWCMWVKTAYTGTVQQYIFTNGRADAGGYGYGLRCDSTSQCKIWFGTSVWDVAVTGGVWTHLVFTKSGASIKIYKNGTLATDTTFSGTLPTFSDGNGLGVGCFHYTGNIYPCYGSVNDFRIYDHCLSAKEVKEISKGLCLHYKLGGVGGENLYIGTRDFSGSSWISRWATDSEKYQGFTVATRSSEWGGLAQNITCKKGDIFTISFYGRIAKGGTIMSIHRSNLGNVVTGLTLIGGNHNGGTWVTATQDGTQWKRYWATLQVTGDTITYLQWRIENSVANKKFDVCGFKLERGSVATPWCPAPSDALYTQLGFANNIEYDLSGFKNNGTKVGAIKWSNDTPRYSGCYHFTTADNITCSMNPSFITGGTLSFWRKADAVSQSWLPLNGTSDNSAYIMATNGSYNFWHGKVGGTLTIYEDGKVVTAPTNDGKWHHYAITGMNLSQWDRVKINTHSQYNNPCHYSDLRIYATALSADDIKELYETSAIATNSGVAMAYELVEE